MQKYIIKGGEKLEGIVQISGSKNAALPIIAATMLNSMKSTLYNVPDIHDTQMMFEILKSLGAKVEKRKNKVIIDTSKINKYEIPEDLMRQMRSSVILAGSLIGRYNRATFSYPRRMRYWFKTYWFTFKRFWKVRYQYWKELWKYNL